MSNPNTFEEFAKLASTNSNTSIKVDFPERTDKSRIALIEEFGKCLPGLYRCDNIVLDIGCGCDLATPLINTFTALLSKLLLVDSKEMLNNLPLTEVNHYVEKFPGKFPNIPELFQKYEGKVDYILCNSVLQYVTAEEGEYFDFIDNALKLLKSGGELLISDIPNKSKAKRFFNTEKGIKYHQDKNKTTDLPEVKIHFQDIADNDVISIVSHYREIGYDTYLLPMSNNLEFSNRREHILIRKY